MSGGWRWQEEGSWIAARHAAQQSIQQRSGAGVARCRATSTRRLQTDGCEGGVRAGACGHPRLRDAVWAGSCAGLTVSAGARTVAHARPCLPCHLPFRNWLSGPGSSRRRRREGWARAARPRRAWYRL